MTSAEHPEWRMAQAHAERGDFSAAARVQRRLVRATPESIIARVVLARYLMDADRLMEAERILTRLLVRAPTHPRVLAQVGLLKLRRGDLHEALNMFDCALDECDFDHVHFMRGNALEMLNRSSEAAASFERAIALWPTHSEAMVALARLRADRQPAEAIQLLRSSLQINKDSVQARHVLIDTYLSERRYRDAMAEAVCLVRIGDDEAQSTGRALVSSILDAAGHESCAAAALRSAVALRGSSFAHRLAGIKCQTLGETIRAMKHYRMALDESLGDGLSAVLLARILRRQGDHIEARQVIESALGVDQIGDVRAKLLHELSVVRGDADIE